MAFRFCFSVALFMSVRTKCDHIPEGSVLMECRDRYFMIAVDGSCIGNEPHFEAVDGTGAYPITRQYAARCGYAVDVVALLGHLELRASYFSCHTGNTDDKVFTFNFNLILTYEGKEVHYALNKTCSPSLPWSPREVTCEVDYMEVSVRTDVVCPSTTNRDWDAALQTVHASAASDWQVVFQTVGQKLMPMNLSEAHRRGYVFDLTEGRLVFRTPYRQPDSFITVMNDVPVEMVHATLFSRQRWVVLMVDMVAACSMHEGSFDERRYMVWKAPEFVHPLVLNLHSTKINAGVNGELVEEGVAEERGYTVETTDNTIQIIILYTAEGWYRKSFVVGDLFEFYVFNLYLEQIAVDEDQVETRLRYYRTLTSPLVLCSVFTIRRTDLEERMFSVYLGGVPRDVELVAVSFNGHTFTLPLTSTSISMIPSIHPNTTHGYTLKVAFDDPVVLHEFHKDSVMMHKLDVYFILATVPENECFYHVTSLIALTNVSPPVFDAFCSESGISFTLDHRPFNYLWAFSIGSDPLTSDLAARHGYVMSNDSQSLQLHVPLFTPGYKYKNVTLKGFLGIFKILVQDKETLEIQTSTVKMCPFNTTTELIVCSTDGRMVVVADLSLGDPSPGIPTRTSLRNKRCRPKEADDTRVLFSFPLHTCGSIIKLGKHSVTYENKIFFSKNLHAATSSSGSDADSVTVQCSYPLRGLQRLFSLHRFESDADGVGCIVHSARANEGLCSTGSAASMRSPSRALAFG
ncbi:uncharacterized protein LOC114848373 [Betta splendens]|uniref:Uncharacterized protein LOC114848373 n=1 Tax=Betta splendens TaxID=158456 RepID=A0A6P7LJZ2_BETSP|nr:uncharacterized protein LOC114848373 [Betta splendens]